MKVKPIWILMKQGIMGWHCHQLGHMQIICTSLQRDKNASASSLNFYRLMLFLMPNLQCQSIERKNSLMNHF